jgi:hypothetical protein
MKWRPPSCSAECAWIGVAGLELALAGRQGENAELLATEPSGQMVG